MRRTSIRPLTSAVAFVALASVIGACNDSSPTNSAPPVGSFARSDLVADATDGSATVDASLVNPWGIAFNTTGSVMWVSDNGAGVSTVYDTLGAKKPVTVTIPSHSGANGAPTGIVFNTTTTFVIPGGASAHWIFAGEDGTIAAWSTGTAATIVVDRSATGAVYKGLALAANGNANFLFATNFRKNTVDVFDSTFTFVKSFTDPNVAAGYAPFGIQAAGGQLYVTFAKRLAPDSTDDDAGAGHGYVDVFNTDGTMAKRLVSNGALNSPWGVTVAPLGFGAFSGDVLVGNFGDGHISAYDPASGTFEGFVGDSTHTALAIDGLWALQFVPSAGSLKLFFSAGPGEESHGIIGMLTPKP
jgi:uncharacterized protein (TIGR03118 family)